MHGTCVDLNGKGILILGASGSGKSGLGLQFVNVGATLVSDDQVRINGHTAHWVDTLKGMIEVRGIGLVNCPSVEKTTLALVIDMDAPAIRFPEVKTVKPQEIELLSGQDVPNLALGAKLLLENGRRA